MTKRDMKNPKLESCRGKLGLSFYEKVWSTLVDQICENVRPDTCRFGLDQYPEIDVAKNGTKTLARPQLDPSKSLKKRDFWIKILEGIWLPFERYLLETKKKPL